MSNVFNGQNGSDDVNRIGNVLAFARPATTERSEPEFSSAERKELRKMLRQFAHLRTACPTARREISED